MVLVEQFTNPEFLDMIFAFAKSNDNPSLAVEIYRQKHPHSRLPTPEDIVNANYNLKTYGQFTVPEDGIGGMGVPISGSSDEEYESDPESEDETKVYTQKIYTPAGMVAHHKDGSGDSDKASSDEESGEASEEKKKEGSEEEEGGEESGSPGDKKGKQPPTDEEIKEYVKQILEGANLEQITMKMVCEQVYSHYPDVDLAHKRDFIKATVKLYHSEQ